MAQEPLFTREEVLGGMPARRARILLFLIERQTAQLIARAGRPDALLPAEQAARERDLAFVQAFALGREPPMRLTIQNLERHAQGWTSLVPESATMRAALAHLIAQKYSFTVDAVPGIRRVLGLDEPAVGAAYARLYHQPIDTIYAERATWGARLDWAWSALGGWLDALPPFWFVFVFTLALGLPQAIIAYPIAVSTVGALPGIALTLLAGALCVVTMASLAEAAARSGVVRYGTAYVGKLAADYLGPAGSGLLSLAVFVLYLATVMGGWFAISRTLAEFTHVPAVLWTVVLFIGGIALLAKGSNSLSLTLLLAFAVVIVVLLAAIMLLALGHFRVENLHGPGWTAIAHGDRPIGNTVGIMLMGFIATAFVVQCAKTVLPRDPSGRSLIWGSVAGLAGIAGVLTLWVVVINGSLDPRLLAGQTATVVTPLATTVSGTAALGVLLVVSLSGLATLRCMIGAYNITREWLPSRVQPPAILPRGGSLAFQRRNPRPNAATIGLTYLGLDNGEPRFRLALQVGATTRQLELTAPRHWDVTRALDAFPEWQQARAPLVVDVIALSAENVQLRASTPLAMSYRNLWNVKTLAGVAAAARAPSEPLSWWKRLFSGHARFVLSVTPIAVTFALTIVFLLTGLDSFPAVLGMLGVITSSVFSGFIPVLLLVASRRKGEVVPGVTFRFLGHPFVIGAVYVIYIALLLVHGLVIWENPILRFAAVLVAILALAVTIHAVRWGAFRTRIVVELCGDDRAGFRSGFWVIAKGAPVSSGVRLQTSVGERTSQAAHGELPALDTLRSAEFAIPATGASELKIWAHHVSASGESEGIAATIELRDDGELKRFDLGMSGGQVVVPVSGKACVVAIGFHQPA